MKNISMEPHDQLAMECVAVLAGQSDNLPTNWRQIFQFYTFNRYFFYLLFIKRLQDRDVTFYREGTKLHVEIRVQY